MPTLSRVLITFGKLVLLVAVTMKIHGLVICNRWPQESVPLEKFDAHAVIINNSADVTCEFSYKNSSSEVIETEFAFPLESTAAVYHLEALIGEKRLIASCRERIEVFNLPLHKMCIFLICEYICVSILGGS